MIQRLAKLSLPVLAASVQLCPAFGTLCACEKRAWVCAVPCECCILALWVPPTVVPTSFGGGRGEGLPSTLCPWLELRQICRRFGGILPLRSRGDSTHPGHAAAPV